MPLTEAFNQLEKQYDLSFSYEDDEVSEIVVNVELTEQPLANGIQLLLEGTGLGYELLDNEFILIKKGLPSTVPLYPTPPDISICGRIYEQLSKEPIVATTVYIKDSNHGTYTDVNGLFNLDGSFSKTDTLIISCIGYESRKMLVGAFMQDPCKKLELSFAKLWMSDILIKDFAIDMITLEDQGNFHFQKEKIPTLPGWGEPDVMRMLQLLPGIGSAEESAARLNVRGGTPDQNLVLWEGIPIYHTGHLFGLYDAFNPFVVKEVDVWRGNFGTNYGGRNSSVIDIKGRPDLVEESTWGVGFNLLHINAFMEKPLFRKSKTKKGAIMVAFRASWVDRIKSKTFTELFNQAFQSSKVAIQEQFQDENENVFWDPLLSYGDFNVKMRWQGKQKNDNSISIFNSADQLNYRFGYDDGDYFTETIDEITTANFGASWQHKASWTPKLKADYTFALSTYSNSYLFRWNEEDRERPFIYRNNRQNLMADVSAHLNHQWLVSDRHKMSFGYQFTGQEAALSVRDTNTVTLESNTWSQDTSRTALHTFFATFDYDVNETFSFSLGIRENHFPKRNLYYSEPRASFVLRPLWDGFSINGGLGRYFQFVFQIIDFGELGIGEPLWYLAGEDIPVQELWQWTLGTRYETKSLLLDFEVYRKDSRNLTSLNLLLDRGLEQPWAFDGTSKATGFDFLLRKRFPPYSLWLAYSFGKVEQRFSDLNEGLPYPPRHDIRHQINWVNTLQMGKWDFSANLHFRTGRPFSVPTIVELPCADCTADTITYGLEFGRLNTDRLPNTIRLDVSATYEFSKANKKWKMGLAFYNLLNRKNLLEKDYLLDLPERDQPQANYELQTFNRAAAGIAPNFFLQYEW